ncbi:hypothetical protein DXB52_15790, partial [Ruminococcus sp. OM04-4AA]
KECEKVLNCFSKISEAAETDFLSKCEKVLNCFSKISEAAETDFLSKYKNDFIEKYGYHRVVPVMEVLDNDIGIGIPAGIQEQNAIEIRKLVMKQHCAKG